MSVHKNAKPVTAYVLQKPVYSTVLYRCNSERRCFYAEISNICWDSVNHDFCVLFFCLKNYSKNENEFNFSNKYWSQMFARVGKFLFLCVKIAKVRF